MKLEGKVGIVIGGSSGSGCATAELFSEEGAKVVIGDANELGGNRVVERIKKRGAEATFVPCDVRREVDCEHIVSETVRRYGHLDILFYSAGVACAARSVVTTSEEEWDLTMDVNAKGVYLMAKHAVPVMAKQGGGAIVNTSSVWGLVAGTGVAAYCAAKGAVVLLTKAMALDHAKDNIRVNCICPGSVDTPMLRGEMESLGGVEKAMPAYIAKHPLKRIAQPNEIARAVLFLVSEDSSFITGVALPVDGGRMAGEVVVI